jgi:hypothetical protein
MKYYSIHYAINKIGRGGYPQAQDIEMEVGKKVTDPDFIWNLRGDTLPNFQPYIGTLILRDGSAVTDFICSAIISTGFVCNDKVVSVINEYSFGDTHFYKLGLKHKGLMYDNYKLMHCLNNYVYKIDYEKSEFKRLRIESNKKIDERYIVHNLEEVLVIKKELSKNKYGDWCYLEPSKIKFQENLKPIHDIFTIWGATYKTYISERLRTALDKSKVTGIQYDFDGEHVEFI